MLSCGPSRRVSGFCRPAARADLPTTPRNSVPIRAGRGINTRCLAAPTCKEQLVWWYSMAMVIGKLICFKQFRRYCIIGRMAETGTVELRIRHYLHFCRTEKGLALNSLDSYRRDLLQLGRFLKDAP